MIAWKEFNHQGYVYDLSHLHPTQIQYVQPKTDTQPERVYTVEVCYSLHCFSKTLEPTADPRLNYSDARETRSFNIERYELSKKLPQIIRELNLKKCMHTGKGNFYVIEVTMPNGVKEDYEVYFEVKPSPTGKGIARLFVQSAYVRDARHGNRLQATKKISLYVILNHRLTGKQIKIPQ